MGSPYNRDVIHDLISDRTHARRAKSELARAVGVSPATVTKWVDGGTCPEPDRWPAIEVALGYEPGTFANESGLGLRIDRDGATRVTVAEVAEAIRAATPAELAEIRALLGLPSAPAPRRASRAKGK